MSGQQEEAADHDKPHGYAPPTAYEIVADDHDYRPALSKGKSKSSWTAYPDTMMNG
jgi:hypothetical protein